MISTQPRQTHRDRSRKTIFFPLWQTEDVTWSLEEPCSCPNPENLIFLHQWTRPLSFFSCSVQLAWKDSSSTSPDDFISWDVRATLLPKALLELTWNSVNMAGTVTKLLYQPTVPSALALPSWLFSNSISVPTPLSFPSSPADVALAPKLTIHYAFLSVAHWVISFLSVPIDAFR